MKTLVVKILTAGFLAAVLLTFSSQLLPVVHQESIPPEVQPPKAVLPPPGVEHLEKVEDLVFEMTNQARRAKGLEPLIKDDELRIVARAYSDDMLVRHFFDHITPEGLSFDKRISKLYRHRVRFIGENIWDAIGYNPSEIHQLAKEIMDSWLSSPTHRENLLDPDFTHLGVGVSARRQMIRATQEFVGKPKAFSF